MTKAEYLKVLPKLSKKIPKKDLLSLFKIISLSIIFFIAITSFSLSVPRFLKKDAHKTTHQKIKGEKTKKISLEYPKIPEVTIPQAIIPTVQVTPTPQSPQEEEKKEELKTTKIDKTTYSVNIQPDKNIGTAMQILNALNTYREKKGRAILTWDTKLAEFSQKRADLFAAQNSTDNHAGFNNFLNANGFNELGFNSLGENSSYGYHVSATNLIEKVFSSDAPHDNNQLDSKWTHAGVGVNGEATDIIFGGNKQ